jgi:hypothetical protein
MPRQPDPVYVHILARMLARPPGCAAGNADEARAIREGLTEEYAAGAFSDAEVCVLYGDPPALQTVAEIKAAARCRGEEWDLSPAEFAIGGYLTGPAAVRCIKRCGSAAAERTLRELLAKTRQRPKPTDAELDAWMARNFKPFDKRESTIKACMVATGADAREAAAAYGRVPKELRRQRGQRGAPRKNS